MLHVGNMLRTLDVGGEPPVTDYLPTGPGYVYFHPGSGHKFNDTFIITPAPDVKIYTTVQKLVSTYNSGDVDLLVLNPDGTLDKHLPLIRTVNGGYQPECFCFPASDALYVGLRRSISTTTQSAYIAKYDYATLTKQWEKAIFDGSNFFLYPTQMFYEDANSIRLGGAYLTAGRIQHAYDVDKATGVISRPSPSVVAITPGGITDTGRGDPYPFDGTNTFMVQPLTPGPIKNGYPNRTIVTCVPQYSDVAVDSTYKWNSGVGDDVNKAAFSSGATSEDDGTCILVGASQLEPDRIVIAHMDLTTGQLSNVAAFAAGSNLWDGSNDTFWPKFNVQWVRGTTAFIIDAPISNMPIPIAYAFIYDAATKEITYSQKFTITTGFAQGSPLPILWGPNGLYKSNIYANSYANTILPENTVVGSTGPAQANSAVLSTEPLTVTKQAAPAWIPTFSADTPQSFNPTQAITFSNADTTFLPSTISGTPYITVQQETFT